MLRKVPFKTSTLHANSSDFHPVGHNKSRTYDSQIAPLSRFFEKQRVSPCMWGWPFSSSGHK